MTREYALCIDRWTARRTNGERRQAPNKDCHQGSLFFVGVSRAGLSSSDQLAQFVAFVDGRIAGHFDRNRLLGCKLFDTALKRSNGQGQLFELDALVKDQLSQGSKLLVGHVDHLNERKGICP